MAKGVRLSTPDQQRLLAQQDLIFFLFLAGSVVAFWKPLKNLFSFSITHDYASHIILIIPVSAYLVYLRRGTIFSSVSTALAPGSFLFLTGTAIWWFAARHAKPLGDDELSVLTLAVVLIWISGFLLCYGTQAFAMGRFPLLFLLLLVPIPAVVIEKITFFLQTGSAWVANELFKLFAVPVFKQGFILRLPTLDIEVARQCSGIRSSLALLISVLILVDFVLRSAWRKALLIFSIVPILILKNALRIVAISLLSIYVSRRFLHGWLHTSGGILFYLLGLVMLIPIVLALRGSESRGMGRDFQPFPAPSATPEISLGEVDRL